MTRLPLSYSWGRFVLVASVGLAVMTGCSARNVVGEIGGKNGGNQPGTGGGILGTGGVGAAPTGGETAGAGGQGAATGGATTGAAGGSSQAGAGGLEMGVGGGGLAIGAAGAAGGVGVSVVPKMPSFAMVPGDGLAERTQVADMNGDGKLDALFLSDIGSRAVRIAPGNGDGTFRDPVLIPVASDAWSFAAGDLDGDGKVDLVVAHSTGQTGFVSVLSNLGNLTFAPAAEIPAVAVGIAVQLADFDGDARLDIAVGGTRSLCSILINKGGGMFVPSGDCTLPSPNSRTRLTAMLAPGDLTGDGKVDLAAIFTDFRAASILANNGDGSFSPGADLPTTAGFGLMGTLALADLDGDGKPEIVVGGSDQESSLGVFPNLGSGSFGAAVRYPGTRTVLGGVTILVGDLNGDGHVDIVTYHHMFLNRGDGTLMVVDPPPWQSASAMGDVNGDGKPDLLITAGVLLNTTP